MMIMPDREPDRRILEGFRAGWWDCLTRRRDVLFQLGDAVLTGGTRVEDLAGLSLAGVFTRGHGALYDAVNQGRIDDARLKHVLAATPLPRFPGNRIVLAIDVSNWLRPGAACAAQRLFCHVYARGKGQAQMIPGWPYSFVVALEPGKHSWVAVLDARRLGPDDDDTQVAATQIRQVIARLTATGAFNLADPPITLVCDAGYDITRLAWLLDDLPVVLVGRLRCDRVFHQPGIRHCDQPGRPARHGRRLELANPATLVACDQTRQVDTTRYGHLQVDVFYRAHPRLARRGAWADHDGQLPLIEGTLIHVCPDHLPGGQDPQPMWLWASQPEASSDQIDSWWMAYLRRFDIEHTFRFFKQQLGWTAPLLRDPLAADRWTWLIIACYTQLRLARGLAGDIRLPWQPPCPSTWLTPARVRRGFPCLYPMLSHPASAPKPTKPGPGRPKGSRNRVKAPIQPVGKTHPKG